MKKHLILLLLSAMALLLQGCKDKTEYCPAYPQEDTDYLPVDFVGQTLRYVFDTDTMIFNIIQPEFSEKYEKSDMQHVTCSAQAWLSLKSLDNKGLLRYSMSYPEALRHNLSVDFQYNGDFVGSAIVYDIYDEIGELERQAVEVLPQWTSPTGKVYTDIMKTVQKTSIGADTLYLSKKYGLLYLDVPGKHSLTLLP